MRRWACLATWDSATAYSAWERHFLHHYVALQMPGALLVERWSCAADDCATMIAWGSLTTLTALVHTPGQLYIARFVLARRRPLFPRLDRLSEALVYS